MKLVGRDHLHWPSLDVELTVDSIDRPGDYPLVSKIAPVRPLPPKRQP